MVIVDCALLLCGFALCIFTAHSDATRGIVENRLMLVGFTAAVILDACAYILIAPWLGITFLTNAVIAIVVSFFCTWQMYGQEETANCSLSFLFCCLLLTT